MISHGSFSLAGIAAENLFICISKLVVHVFLIVWVAL